MAGSLWVLSGPPGAGVNSVISDLMQGQTDFAFETPKSMTTMPMREGDRQGDRHYFVTNEEFQEHLQADAFMTFEAVDKGHFGILWTEVLGLIEQGYIVLIKVRADKADRIRRRVPGAKLVFVDASRQICERRLRDERQRSEYDVRQSLARGDLDREYRIYFDYAVTNHNSTSTADDIAALIRDAAKTASEI